MKHFLMLLKWDVLLLHRNRLFLLAAVVAAIYIGVFYLLKPLGNLTSVLVILIFNDPVVTGYLFAAVLLLFDKNQNTLQAISVLPVPFKTYLLSKAILLSGLATGVAFIMALATQGWQFNGIHLLAGTFFSALLFSFGGFAVSALARNFNQLLFYSVPLLVTAGLPFLALFGFGQLLYYGPFPSTGGLILLQAAFTPVTLAELLFGYAQLFTWTFLSWRLALKLTQRTFQ